MNATDAASADVAAGVGAAIRAVRRRAGWSMRDLAAKAGLSQPFLSNIENGRAMPSVATLYRLAGALGVGPQDLLPTAADEDLVVVRGGEGHDAPVDDEPGAALSRLLVGAPGRILEVHQFDVAPGQPLGGWFEHDGEDLVVVLAGHLHVELADGRAIDLRAGDLAWHRGEIAHRWSSRGRSRTRILLVNARVPGPPPGSRPAAHR